MSAGYVGGYPLLLSASLTRGARLAGDAQLQYNVFHVAGVQAIKGRTAGPLVQGHCKARSRLSENS